MTKENRALELQNVELRKQSADVRAENLEVSECVILTTQCDGKEQRAGAA